MYFKLSWRNMKKYITDYFIYAVTVIVLIAVMYISVLFTIVGKMASNLQANSLPVLIVCVMICLISYISNYILSRRSKELALYMYMGMDKNSISNLFFLELFVVSFICFVVGMVLAIVLASIAILPDMETSIPIAVLINATVKTFLYFLVIQVAVLIWERKKIRKLQIKDMLNKRKIYNEKEFCRKKVFVWANLFGISFITFIILFVVIVFNFDERATTISIGLISIPFIFSIIFFYRLVLEIFNKLRNQHSTMFYNNDRLFIVAWLLKKLKANSLLFSLTALCLIVSICANVTSVVFTKADIPFDNESKFWMILAQRLVSIVFLVIFFSVLSIRQVSDLRESVKNINILESMGKTKTNIRLILLKQIVFNFFTPMVMPVGITILIARPLEQFLFQFTNQDNLLLGEFIKCILFLVPMFLIYLFSAYITSIKMLEKSDAFNRA